MADVDVRCCLRRASELAELSDSARLDVEVILSWVLGKDRSFLFTWPEHQLSCEQLEQFERAFARRKAGEPVAHITGEREFWSLSLLTDASTLIPRPDTECLVELALARLPKTSPRILDLGTGTGAIALALASERADAEVMAVDVVDSAVALARKNAERLQIANIEIKQSHWFSAVNGRFDVIVSNPPYIDADDEHLQQGDVRFEPLSALVAEKQGLADLQLIVEQAPAYLNEGGWLLMEHGWQQGEAVRHLLLEKGYTDVATEQDFGGNDRVSLGRWAS